MNHLIRERSQAEKWDIDSAGTSSWHIGDRPDTRALRCLSNHGLSTAHIGRQVCKEDFRTYRYILAMDKTNISDLKEMAPTGATAKVDLLGTYDPEGVLEVDDPYYGGPADFEKVYQHCLRACAAFLDKHSS